jgi:hypothetical protein
MIAGLSLLVAIISVIVPSVYAAVDEDDKKEICEDNGGDWKKGQCDFDGDEDKADRYGDDLDEKWRSNEAIAKLEDDYVDAQRDNDNYDNDDNFNDYVNDGKLKVVNKDDDDDNKKYGVESKDGDNLVTRYYDDKDDAEEAYENLDKDELTHSDKSYSDWEYDDEEHPSLK